MSVSDLMTGLMVIFLFIAISYIRKVQENQTVLTDYVETKTQLHDKLVKEFEGDTSRWQMTIGKDLSMRFNNPQVLFAPGSSDLTTEFKQILDEFLPRYFDILLNDSLRSEIVEIRVEGHTDDVPYPQLDSDPYIANVILSQRRSLSVLQYFRSMPDFEMYSEEEKKLLEYWFTANGLSYGKSVDNDGNYTIKSNKAIDKDRSRRVEFRIVTSGEDVLENFVNGLK
ncbi:MAG: OmpA family protein [Bacteroidales bacterium]|nr:OmpA family protein [Bacteroidales bacterium]MBQ3680055.1 OmpA family protein [Paludibacteraceae bacterium]MBR0497913.1 OmpA family protein [Paludibacteraceae bacterium]